MDAPLALELPADRPPWPGPFTPAMARDAGLGRTALDRMVRAGAVRRVLRGVYVATSVPDTVDLRARSLALVLPPASTVVDRTAGWWHGLIGSPGDRLDVLGRRGNRYFGARRRLGADESVAARGIRATSPLRTCADLGRLLRPDRALSVLDRALHIGLVRHVDLLAQLPRSTGLRGAGQLRRLAPLADPRARHQADSTLRLRWLDAGLPTPTPGLVVPLPTGPVRLSLGLPEDRFAVGIHEDCGPDPVSSLAGCGWRVVLLGRARVLGSDAELVQRRLAGQFHEHLLAATG